MVVVGGVPSPWGEAAKGILHVKQLDWIAVRLAYDDAALKQWAGELSGPVLMVDDEPARSGWEQILHRLEALAPQPALLPAEPAAREQVLGISRLLCDENGLAWSRRLQLVHLGLGERGGFSQRIAGYLAAKYGYQAERGETNALTVAELLANLARRLHVQQQAGSPYYVGDRMSAADIYSAACMSVLRPLPHEQCEMHAATRAVFETRDERTDAALDPILLQHRDRMYAEHLPLPLSL
jgi:glutathione S-transferase